MIRPVFSAPGSSALEELNHNPVSMLSEIPLTEIERRASELVLHSRINYAYRSQA